MGNVCSMVRSFCALEGNSLRGEGNCVSVPAAATTAMARRTSARMRRRKRRCRRASSGRPGPAACARGRNSRALAAAAVSSSASRMSLTIMAVPQSVSVKPRKAGTWTRRLSRPATARMGTAPAARREKRRTASI